MSSNHPTPGEIIYTRFRFRNEKRSKPNRPCLIINVKSNNSNLITIYIIPISHNQPNNLNKVIEIPSGTRRSLGLSPKRCRMRSCCKSKTTSPRFIGHNTEQNCRLTHWGGSFYRAFLHSLLKYSLYFYGIFLAAPVAFRPDDGRKTRRCGNEHS